MNTRSLAYLAGATVLVAAVAAITLKRGEVAVRATPAGGKLFPNLSASINDVATIELKRKDGVTTLQRTGDAWGLAEKSGFPVEMASVRKTLIGFSELTATEPKTEDPGLYSKLGVDDPGKEGATSTLVTLKDASGKPLASLIVGKDHASKSFSGPHQAYVRKPEETRSWLASGDLDLKEKSADWLDKKILEVKRERIRAAEIRRADGEALVVDREKPETKDFTLHDIPEGKELAYPAAPTSIADALGYLNLEDVVPATEVDMKEGATSTAKFSCFDGLTITVTTKEAGEKTYARFEASYEKPPESTGPPAPPEAAKPEDPEKKEVETKDAAASAKPKSAEEVQKEAADLNARLSKWVYQIPSYNKASFEKKKTELLKDKTAPGADGSATAPGEQPNEGESIPPPAPEEKPDDGSKPPPPESKPPH
jgi:hypothetical protein